MKTVFLTCLSLLLLFCSGAALAQIHADESEDDDTSDTARKPDSDDAAKRDHSRSEYTPEDFIDTNFGKSTFRELFDAGERMNARPDFKLRLDLFAEKRFRPDADELKPIKNQVFDWVPGDVDRLNNGGFALAPFNGSPVPYRLNGHINIERPYPWDKGN